MKSKLIVAATAAVLMSPFAMAQDPAASPEGSAESCASLQAKFDADIKVSQSASASQAQTMRDEGAKLCNEGRTDEGVAKLKEALTHLSAPAPAAPQS